jgi:hypothetical protein
MYNLNDQFPSFASIGAFRSYDPENAKERMVTLGHCQWQKHESVRKFVYYEKNFG